MKSIGAYMDILRSFKIQEAARLGIQSLGIFGSVARGEAREDSDLDVFVQLEKPDYMAMAEIQERLEGLCGCRVDLVRLRPTLRPLLQERIKRDGILA